LLNFIITSLLLFSLTYPQVVGVSDTGLDDRSCYFIDPSKSKDIRRSTITDPFVDLDRRKVVQYSHLSVADTEDLTAGHGTHVAGTVAGYNEKPLSTDGQYSGVAPRAKIAFLDIATASGSLYIPPVSQQYKALETADAHICTNSWGSGFSSKGGYYANGKIDGYLYKNMDTLILFANGNSGGDGLGSVLRQASSKNVVSVG
jgi:subtilisin family serine protease